MFLGLALRLGTASGEAAGFRLTPATRTDWPADAAGLVVGTIVPSSDGDWASYDVKTVAASEWPEDDAGRIVGTITPDFS
ncbi:hypothetical protein FJU08_17610 [Martelella alba]|uniref:Uncharacterized protein n=1 Tax=Martelella alba TaxID=2590451 RepID=A0A506U466_9HYPH|nr:hypothetical protein [Martelella alba]TPW28620.1 hypothetical protein FJU08_17610 [Martelella alba]